jgi:hypothetical protein
MLFLKNLRIVLWIALVLGSTDPAFAEGQSGNRLVTYIEVLVDGSLIVEAEGGWQNPDGCMDRHRIYVPSSNPFIDRYYAAVLSSYTTGNYVWAWLKNCASMPWGEQFPIALNLATRRR